MEHLETLEQVHDLGLELSGHFLSISAVLLRQTLVELAQDKLNDALHEGLLLLAFVS